MIQIWDAILAKGIPLVASWSSDAHRVGALGPCTYIQSPNSGFDNLMHSFFEGRTYMASRAFTGRVAFNLADGDPDPYPAQFPVYVPGSATAAGVHLGVSSGLSSGNSVKLVVNGAVQTTQAVSGTSLNRTFSVPLASTATTYARAEVLNSSGVRLAMTQALLFVPVPGLPAGHQCHVQRVSHPSRPIFTKAVTKGIVGATYDTSSAALALTLSNPTGSLIELALTTPDAPTTVVVDGTSITPAATFADYQAATGSAWFTSGASMNVKVLHASTSAKAVVRYAASTGDRTPPSVPSGLGASQSTSGPVTLTWTGSTDAVGVAGYTVYRDGAALATTGASTVTYVDSATAAGVTYRYAVDAFDAAGNHSASGGPLTFTTRSADTTTTLNPTADSYVLSSSPSSNFGKATTFRVDADGIATSYLRFTVPPTAGSVVSATLRIFPTSSQSTGYDVYPVPDDTWTETGLTWSNAPDMATTKTGSSGKVTASTWTGVDVTALLTDALVNHGGDVNLGLKTTNTTALALSSRQGTNPPQLVLVTSS
jgi:hypothetical protein